MRRLMWVVLVALLGACSGNMVVDGGTGGGSATGGGHATGGGGSATGGGGGQSLTPAAFCEQRVAAYCNTASACGTFESTQGCLMTQEHQRLDFGVPDLCTMSIAAVADGRASFNSSVASDCLTQLASACDSSPSACRNAITPLVAQGGSCFNGLECVQGTFCQNFTDCPGTCLARAAAGQRGVFCLEGLFSSIEVLDGGSYVQVCRALGVAGQHCDRPGTCVDGLTCRGDTNTCGTPRADGEACVTTSTGIFAGMIFEDCGPLRACQPLGTDGGFICAPPSGLGQPCGLCKGDLRCLNGSCAPKSAAGQACRTISDCGLGLVCLGGPLSGTTCEVRRAAGAHCSGTDDCQAGLDCATFANDAGISERSCAPTDAGVSCFDRTP